MTHLIDRENHPLFVTATLAKKLEKLGIHRPFDLVLHLPLRYEDETHLYAIAKAPYGQKVLIEGEVIAHEIQCQRRRQLVAWIKDASGSLLLRFINFYPSQIKQFATGNRVRALGEIRRGFATDEMVHPKIREVGSGLAIAESMTPIYPTVKGLTQSTLRKLIHTELASQSLDETLPHELAAALPMIPFAKAIRLLHLPTSDYTPRQLSDPRLPAWQRLKFDELLAQQLSMRLVYRARRQCQAPPLRGKGQFSQALIDRLPFALTDAQQRALEEIHLDLTQSHPMNRLLQGDVGSGKTIVAALAALTAIESGYQVALMAPTEILAEQHFLKLSGWLAPLGLGVHWLGGSLRKRQKQATLTAISGGETRLAVGTQALFQEKVAFKNLGLVIVDEQHRFGVGQRLALTGKGVAPHQLVMSATPIPRTLAMSFYADLDVSVINELPRGRQPIITKLLHSSRREEIVAHLAKICADGQQAYWVCPLIEESASQGLNSAVEIHQQLTVALPKFRVGLIHGRMKTEDKTSVMLAFAKNEVQVLVATTVIEVGMDVPNASLMIIEHADRMGLAQLHQLRGRVGRGRARSVCVLMFAPPLSDLAKLRLKVIYENLDGFEIARQDLLMRGPGELLGPRQSGLPMLRFANLEEDRELLEKARKLAPLLLAQDPKAAAAHLDRWLGERQQFLTA